MTEQLNLCQNINIEPGRRSRTLTGWQSSGLGGGQVTPVAQRPAESRQAAGVRRYCGKVCSNLGKVKNAVPGQWHNNKPKLYEGSGYIYVWEPDHPHARRYGWVFEHRLVMEKVLGRYLTQEEEVTTSTRSRTTTGRRTSKCWTRPRTPASPSRATGAR